MEIGDLPLRLTFDGAATEAGQTTQTVMLGNAIAFEDGDQGAAWTVGDTVQIDMNAVFIRLATFRFDVELFVGLLKSTFSSDADLLPTNSLLKCVDGDVFVGQANLTEWGMV